MSVGANGPIAVGPPGPPGQDGVPGRPVRTSSGPMIWMMVSSQLCQFRRTKTADLSLLDWYIWCFLVEPLHANHLCISLVLLQGPPGPPGPPGPAGRGMKVRVLRFTKVVADKHLLMSLKHYLTAGRQRRARSPWTGRRKGEIRPKFSSFRFFYS